MKTIIEAKIFKNGGSNAIRLPASLKITEPVVYLVVDNETGIISLKREKPSRLDEFFALQEQFGSIGDDDWLPQRSHEPEPIRQSIQDLIDGK